MTEPRRAELERVIELVGRWARSRGDVRALGLAGSWARDEPRMSSDADLVVLVDDPAVYLADHYWVVPALGQDAPIVRTRRWGPLTERRVRLASRFEIEVGFVAPSWAAVDPLDAGTAQVVCAGFGILHDEDDLLAELIDRCAIGRGAH